MPSYAAMCTELEKRGLGRRIEYVFMDLRQIFEFVAALHVNVLARVFEQLQMLEHMRAHVRMCACAHACTRHGVHI